MYNQWLYFFNSPLKETGIKRLKNLKNLKNLKSSKLKETQQVKKEWLDDGSMKISGEKPNKWSITLQPILSTDIYTIDYELQNEISEAKYLFKRAFKNRDKNLFNQGEQLYNNSIKKQKDIDIIQLDNNKLLTNIKEKIFQIRRNIYLTVKENPTDKKKILLQRLTNELETALIEQSNIVKNINEKENNYILRSQSIIRQGPIPEPPIIKSLSSKIGREKFRFEKKLEEFDEEFDEEELIGLDNTEDKNINGGYIKVIKLNH